MNLNGDDHATHAPRDTSRIKNTISKIIVATFLLPLSTFGQLPSSTFWKKHISKLYFATTAQNLNASLCSSALTIQTQNWLGAAFNTSSNLTVNLSGPASVTFYSDSACTQPISTATIASGTNSVSVYFLSTSTGSPILSASATSYASTSQTETISINPFIWTGGGGDANWNTAANWSGGAAPGSGNVAVFDNTCSANCSPSINVNINVSGVRVHTGYSGTITQGAGFTITLGTKGWTQLGGTFSGGNSSISSTGAITLAGGSFTSTSGNFTASSNWTISNSPTFNTNSGTLVFNGANTITPGSVHYNNVTFSSSGATHSLNGGTMLIDGLLSLASTATTSSLINSGTLKAYGNVTASSYGSMGNATLQVAGNAAGQTIAGITSANIPTLDIAAGTNNVTLSGTLLLAGSYSVTSVGTLTTTGSTLIFNGGGTITPGATHYNHVTFTGFVKTYELGGATMHIDGTLTLASISSSPPCTINAGTLMAHGDVVTSNNGQQGTAIVQLAGNAAGQTITGTSSAGIPNLTIDAGTNNVTFNGTVWVRGIYTLTSVGTLTTTGSTLTLTGGGTITPGSVHYNNVTFASYVSSYSLGNGTMYIDGTLSLASTSMSPPGSINSGIFMIYGNVVASSFGAIGNAQIQFAGNTPQTMTAGASANLPTGNVTVNITGGTLNLGSNVSWNNTGQTLSVNSGGVNMTGYNLTVKSLNLNGNTVTKGGGTLTVNGSVAGTGGLYGGTVNP